MQKCYNIMVTGKVQDIGFRALIEDIAKLLGLRGFAFNDIDGSVKMVCCGETGVINKFFNEIKARGMQKGVVIEDIAKQELPFLVYLPEKFSRIYTDEFGDLGRKLDIGIDVLRDIKADTSVLSSFVVEQREHNKEQRDFNNEMREHNRHLEKILEKLAEG